MSKLTTFRIGGVHPDDAKLSRACAIEVLPLPQTVYISMAQHLGAPAKPVVAAGDKVKTGQVIAEPGGFISAYVHSSVSGTVKSIAPRADLAGRMVTHVEIAVEGDEWAEGIDLSDTLASEIPQDVPAMLECIKACGVVGLGGATFPTHVKLNPGPNAKAECLIINGAECEPYLTSDFRIMLERSREIIVGAAIMQKILGGCRCVVGIEENKPEAISAMEKACAELGYPDISVLPLKKKYPQGGEKQLIDAVLRRQVKSGRLPISEGAVVQNVATSLAVYEAVQKHKPLITNVLTITGDCIPVEKQHNYLFRIGMPLSYIAEYAGGVPEGAAKIVSGGPMMGKAIVNLDACTVKGSSSILYLSAAATRRGTESACIRCGRCAEACPMGLEPFLLRRLALAGDQEAGLEANAVQDCIECGCCLYSCPAQIPLLDIIRQSKAEVMSIMRARAAEAKAAAAASSK
ncbi:MAG: electron transport complex subunit RsxC [Bacteroidia bacterium]|nr:electron transport complex subunit RsxC [Bacteroidia bacterium]